MLIQNSQPPGKPGRAASRPGDDIPRTLIGRRLVRRFKISAAAADTIAALASFSGEVR